jgi:hypothetical protein
MERGWSPHLIDILQLIGDFDVSLGAEFLLITRTGE